MKLYADQFMFKIVIVVIDTTMIIIEKTLHAHGMDRTPNRNRRKARILLLLLQRQQQQQQQQCRLNLIL